MREIYYAQAILEAQVEEMERDKNVFILGLDVGKFGGAFGQCAGMVEKFGSERVFDTPISESGYLTAAVGAALAGKRPIAEIQFADFITYAFDGVVNQAAKHRYMSGGTLNVPMVIRAPGGAGFSMAAQHSQCIESWFLNVPGLKIVIPSTPYDLKGLLKTAIRDDDPVLFIENKALYGTKGEIPDEEYTIPLGKAKIVKDGSDVTVIAMQTMINPAIEAAKELEKEGISVEIIDPRCLVPFDKETVYKSVEKTGRVVIAHEAPKRGGVGGEISSLISEDCFESLKAPIMRVGSANCPIPFGKAEFFVLPCKDDIVKNIKAITK